jgi:hypothetical protein
VAVHVLPDPASQRGDQVAVHALPDPEQVKEAVRWPFTHCQIQNKSAKDPVHGYSRTTRSCKYRGGFQIATHALTDTVT